MLTASASGLYLFGAQWPPPPIPLFTLRRAPRDAQRKTQGRVVRYSFLVRNFHSLLHTGLSRRTNIAISPTTQRRPVIIAKAVAIGLRSTMNLLRLICSVLFLASFSHADNQTQVFPASSGPVRITPLNHASTLIEAGGKVIYLDPPKPVKFAGQPKADLILITDISGDHMDPDADREITKNGTEILAPPAGGRTGPT